LSHRVGRQIFPCVESHVVMHVVPWVEPPCL